MPELPAVNGKDVVRAFKRVGFVLDRITGSHHILKRPGCTLSVPVHAGKDYGKSLLKKQIEAAGMTVAEFVANL